MDAETGFGTGLRGKLKKRQEPEAPEADAVQRSGSRPIDGPRCWKRIRPSVRSTKSCTPSAKPRRYD